MTENEPKQFLMRADRQETLHVTIIKCSLFHAVGFSCVRPVLHLKVSHVFVTGFQVRLGAVVTTKTRVRAETQTQVVEAFTTDSYPGSITQCSLAF